MEGLPSLPSLPTLTLWEMKFPTLSGSFAPQPFKHQELEFPEVAVWLSSKFEDEKKIILV